MTKHDDVALMRAPSFSRPSLFVLSLALAGCGSAGGGRGEDIPDHGGAPTSPDERETSSPKPPAWSGSASDPLAPDETDVDEEPEPEPSTEPEPPPEPKPTTPPTTTTSPVPEGWLYTDKNRIKAWDGRVWQGRGANIAEMRGCNACSTGVLDEDEVIRRIDVLTDEWGADFLRLTLESYGTSSVLTDEEYLAKLERVIDHVGTKPGVYVLLANWISPTFTPLGWPSDRTRAEWVKLAERFADDGHVMFGLVNEPQHNYDGARDAEVWRAMNDAVAAIRAVEDERGTPHHIIAVQGTGGWARFLDYYTTHPITAGGGDNIAYEVHVYDDEVHFPARFINPSKKIPVIIGEFGPWEEWMKMKDTKKLMELADKHLVPWLAWTFHMRCPPNLIEDHSNGGCGVGMPLRPTPWGLQVKEALGS